MEILEEIGLTKNEVLIYKSLLQMGQTTAGPLAKRSGMHRSRVYEALERLVSQGIVSYTTKSNKKYFQAQNPEVLLNFIDEKKKRLNLIIPELKELQMNRPEKQEANVFEGYKGLKSVFENAVDELRSGDEILVFGARSGQDVSKETWDYFFKQFNERRIKKGVKYKIIFNEDLRKSEIVEEFKKSKLTEVKFLSQNTPAGINIHGENVAIIVWKKNPYAFLITSKEVNQSFREYFGALWKIAKH